MNNPLISVIIPIFNVESYLHQCVESVLAQTYNNIEIILVDDGSPDNSPKICDEFALKDNRIRVIHKKNGGLSEARNVGFSICKGSYVFYLDSDDYLEPNCIGQLFTASAGGVLSVAGYILNYSSEGRIVIPEQAYGVYHSLKDYLLDFSSLFATKFNFAWGKLYDAEIIRKNNIKFQNGVSLIEDIIFNLDYYRYVNNGINLISANGYYYRQHSETTLSKKFDDRMFSWNEFSYGKIRDFLREYSCFTEKNRVHLYSNVLGNYHYCFYLVALNNHFSIKEKVSLIKKNLDTPIYIDSLSVKNDSRIDARLFNWLLKNRMIKTYIFIQQLKQIIKHGIYKKNIRTT